MNSPPITYRRSPIPASSAVLILRNSPAARAHYRNVSSPYYQLGQKLAAASVYQRTSSVNGQMSRYFERTSQIYPSYSTAKSIRMPSEDVNSSMLNYEPSQYIQNGNCIQYSMPSWMTPEHNTFFDGETSQIPKISKDRIIIRKYSKGSCGFLNKCGMCDHGHLLGFLNFYGIFNRDKITFLYPDTNREISSPFQNLPKASPPKALQACI